MEELAVDTTGNGLHRSATLTDRSFNSITAMSAYGCDNLGHLTCLVLMPNLRILKVEDCKAFRAMINEEKLDEVVGKGQILQPFSNLTMMGLLNLPKLESIYSKGTLPLRFLTVLLVSGCPNLKRLPISLTNVSGYSQILVDADENWWDAIEWEEDATNDALASRFKLNF